jgi:CheY-like chemotaxis protein
LKKVNQKIALSILKRLGYQDVTIASNGKEALDLILKQEFDVVFVWSFCF